MEEVAGGREHDADHERERTTARVAHDAGCRVTTRRRPAARAAGSAACSSGRRSAGRRPPTPRPTAARATGRCRARPSSATSLRSFHALGIFQRSGRLHSIHMPVMKRNRVSTTVVIVFMPTYEPLPSTVQKRSCAGPTASATSAVGMVKPANTSAMPRFPRCRAIGRGRGATWPRRSAWPASRRRSRPPRGSRARVARRGSPPSSTAA